MFNASYAACSAVERSLSAVSGIISGGSPLIRPSRFFSTSIPQPNSQSTPTSTNRPDAAEATRIAMRSLPQPVVIITTADPNSPLNRRGLTLSSLTSLSLHPIPLLSFNIRLPSRASGLLHRSGRFVVHILPASQRYADLCAAFATSEYTASGDQDVKDPWAMGYEWKVSGEGQPVLEGALVKMHCKVRRTVEVGDHEVWVGEVTKVNNSQKEGEYGLLYCDRKYRSVLGELEEVTSEKEEPNDEP
ncbi:hypothetical protein SAICODRAFT_31348 [Saitoella complicata NRRL Y-17804]|uniref:Flavin reductase like domain-containing protein n=1 Tax=Saitoella complicata (strain BCRC 22490 / CBS 7301 / JCM 7358 / NBRC 10748 / NRRL Y-17804) TaxID=698492 RepID=A0A0E9NEE5_SAICN|nr:uncharacterized protein SAICODRAFT_31348 [Saitoella complicata NRRL Y-17804]ODQ51407.1 hypothetical protein SAICODRAFT_31348 [Saitoella complicata NRRL Y-17804]GAO48227.1 hypothetical protein G7K_2407-t1 [Saitoella complicata NRRL Y-17804]